jgi:hypothetical protein
MLWWLLLFMLSSVAQYDLELWIEAIAVNSSPQAVPIEAALDIALEVLPELVHAGMLGGSPAVAEPVRRHRPSS